MLITVQVGLLLGALSVLSLPIDHSAAEIWVASPEVLSIELGYPIPESWRSRLASMPEVVDTEPYLYGFSYWRKPQGGSEVCCVIGSRLERRRPRRRQRLDAANAHAAHRAGVCRRR